MQSSERRRRDRPSSHKSKLGTRKRFQHLCLDKTYISEQEEQETNQTRICAAYTNQEEERKRRRENDNQKPKAIQKSKKYSPKRWVVHRENKLLA